MIGFRIWIEGDAERFGKFQCAQMQPRRQAVPCAPVCNGGAANAEGLSGIGGAANGGDKSSDVHAGNHNYARRFVKSLDTRAARQIA